jgi:HD-like signal output (HDOD) protein
MALKAADIAGASVAHPEIPHLLQELPALPTISTRLLAMIGRADVDLKSVSTLIASDGALTGEVLRIANSSLFGLRNEVRTILQAIAYLGIERTKSLAWTVAIKNYLGNALQIPSLQRSWRHSLAVALLAEELANWTQADGSEAYTSGILHDLGALGLIAMSPPRYRQLLEEAAGSPDSLLDLERKHFGLDHCEAGGFLAAAWKLPAFTPLGLIHFATRGADLLGFSVISRPVDASSPNAIEEFHEQLAPRRRERVVFNLADLQLLIATRLNAIES